MLAANSGQNFYLSSGQTGTGFNFGATGVSGFGNIDPFNYPMPGRKDLMSLSTIDASKDAMKTTTRKFATKRFESSNLHTGDIEGN